MTGVIGFDYYLVTASNYDEHGFLSIQFDAFGEQGVEPAIAKMPLGLYARPLDPVVDPTSREPDPTQACEVLIGQEGGQTHAIPLCDVRTIPILPILEKGETLLHNSFGTFVRLDSARAISLFTTEDGTPNGPSVYSSTAPDGFIRFGSTFAEEKLDRTGWHLKLPFGRIDLSYVGGMPAPFTSLAGQFSVEVPAVYLEASAIALGPAAAPQQPIALGTSTVAAFATVVAEFGNVVAALDTLVTVFGTFGTGLAVAGGVAKMTGPQSTAFEGAVATIVSAAAAITAATATVESNAVTAY